MSDLKTVTFDASQWQLVPKVPTDAMANALVQCAGSYYSLAAGENRRIAIAWAAMLAVAPEGTAPTPAAQSADHFRQMADMVNHSGEATEKVAAQSAGQEPIGYLGKHDAEWLRTTPDVNASCVILRSPSRGGIAIYAAPVNGGERELGQVIDERDRAEAMAEKLADAIAKHFGVEIGEHSNLNCPWQNALDNIAYMSTQNDKRDCEKCGGDCSAANPPVIHCPMEKHAADAPQVSDEIACSSCGLTLTQSRALSSPAKVGGDEREVQSHFERQGWEVLPIHTFSELTEAIRDYVQAHAALSADGGEDKLDAERYRWLVERFVGYDFDWMPSEPDAADGASVAVFEIGREFRGSRDITASIDDHRAAKAKGE